MSRFTTILLLLISFFLISCIGENEKSPAEEEVLVESDKENAATANENVPDKNLSEPVDPVDKALETVTAEQKIAVIRKEYQRIIALPANTKSYTFTCDVEGKVTYHMDNDKVVKTVIDWGYLGDGRSVDEFYYKDDKLIFIYTVTVGGPAGLPEKRYEQRTYVYEDKSIKYMEDEKVTTCTKCSFKSGSIPYRILRAAKTGDVKNALCPG